MTIQTRTRNAKPKIERAAVTLFIEEGVDAATTRQIAERAGVSEGALYRHYKGKEELAEALFMGFHDRMSKLLIDAALTGNNLQARVQSIVTAYCSLADEEWELCCYHLLNLNRFIKHDIRREDDPVSLTEALIADLIENKAIPEGDSSLLAAMCLGVITQAAQNKAYNRLPGKFSDYKEGLSIAIIAILKTREV